MQTPLLKLPWKIVAPVIVKSIRGFHFSLFTKAADFFTSSSRLSTPCTAMHTMTTFFHLHLAWIFIFVVFVLAQEEHICTKLSNNKRLKLQGALLVGNELRLVESDRSYLIRLTSKRQAVLRDKMTLPLVAGGGGGQDDRAFFEGQRSTTTTELSPMSSGEPNRDEPGQNGKDSSKKNTDGGGGDQNDFDSSTEGQIVIAALQDDKMVASHRPLQPGELERVNLFLLNGSGGGSAIWRQYIGSFDALNQGAASGCSYLDRVGNDEYAMRTEHTAEYGVRLMSTISDGKSPTAGYVLHYDEYVPFPIRDTSESQAKIIANRRRVVITPIAKWQQPLDPSDRSGVQFPIEFPEADLKSGKMTYIDVAYHLEVDDARTKVTLVKIGDSSSSDRDLFLSIPVGFILGRTVYLFGHWSQEVISFEYRELTGDQVQLPITVSKMADFFYCPAVGQQSGGGGGKRQRTSPWMSMAEYRLVAAERNMDDWEVSNKSMPGWMWLVIVAIAMVCALVFSLFMWCCLCTKSGTSVRTSKNAATLTKSKCSKSSSSSSTSKSASASKKKKSSTSSKSNKKPSESGKKTSSSKKAAAAAGTSSAKKASAKKNSKKASSKKK